ncbi:uncharacterized protein LOC113467932 [Diaphorina citri]|uniref:Uncharacterized protein LOC113467932 n=1 Tax=Diaphorina citri TaxID=121845 RepID=A0A3Q0J0K8_DIACI|nr:uncharacterized protein LOC113467932 [Diaphorina citri]
MNRFLKLAVLVISINAISAYPSQPNDADQSVTSNSDSTIANYIEKVTTFVKSCGDKELTSCLKMRSLTYVDKMLRKNNEIPIVDGLTIVSSEDKNSLRDLNGRALSDEDFQTKSDDEIENLFMDRIARFLSTHVVQFKMPTTAVNEMKRSLDEGKHCPLLTSEVLSHGIKASHHHQSHVGGFHNSGGAGYQGHAYEDSILGGGSLFGIVFFNF